MIGKPGFYGSTTVGQRGQIVLPAKLREKFGINPGDKLLVLGGEKTDIWGIFIVKADVLGKMLDRFGEEIREILQEDSMGEDE